MKKTTQAPKFKGIHHSRVISQGATLQGASKQQLNPAMGPLLGTYDHRTDHAPGSLIQPGLQVQPDRSQQGVFPGSQVFQQKSHAEMQKQVKMHRKNAKSNNVMVFNGGSNLIPQDMSEPNTGARVSTKQQIRSSVNVGLKQNTLAHSPPQISGNLPLNAKTVNPSSPMSKGRGTGSFQGQPSFKQDNFNASGKRMTGDITSKKAQMSALPSTDQVRTQNLRSQKAIPNYGQGDQVLQASLGQTSNGGLRASGQVSKESLPRAYAGYNNFAQTQANSHVQSINGSLQSSSMAFHPENLQSKIAKKRILSSNKTGGGTLNAQKPTTGHHRIQSNPAYLNNSNKSLAQMLNAGMTDSDFIQHQYSNNPTISNSHIPVASHERQMNSRQTAQRPIALPKTQQAQSRVQKNIPGVNPDQQHYVRHQLNTNQTLQGAEPALDNLFSKALNTLGSGEGQNMSRQEAVGTSDMAIKKNGGKSAGPGHQKALSMSTYMMQPKQVGNHNQTAPKGASAGSSNPNHVKSFSGTHYQQLDDSGFQNNSSQLKSQASAQLIKQHSIKSQVQKQQLSNKGIKASMKMAGQPSGQRGIKIDNSGNNFSPHHAKQTYSPTSLTQQKIYGQPPEMAQTYAQHHQQKMRQPSGDQSSMNLNQKKRLKANQPSGHTTGAHRRNMSDQVPQMQAKNGYGILNKQQPQKGTHTRSGTGVNTSIHRQQEEIPMDGAPSSSERIVVINNNNTNIKYVNFSNVHNINIHQGTFPQGYSGPPKSLTQQNHSIRSSINNSLGGLEPGILGQTGSNQESLSGLNYIAEVMNPATGKVYENSPPGMKVQAPKSHMINKAKLDTWVKNPRSKAAPQQQQKSNIAIVNGSQSFEPSLHGLNNDRQLKTQGYYRPQQSESTLPGNDNLISHTQLNSNVLNSIKSIEVDSRPGTRGANGSSSISKGQHRPSIQNKTADQRMAKFGAQSQSSIQQVHQLQNRRTIKDIGMNQNQQLQLKPNQGDRSSNMVLSSERQSNQYSNYRFDASGGQQPQYQSSSAAQLQQPEVGNFSYEGSYQQQLTQSNNYSILSSGNFQSLAPHAKDSQQLLQQQHNNFMVPDRGGPQSKTQQRVMKKKSTTLSKGQKQLREILNHQQQLQVAPRSPSKQSHQHLEQSQGSFVHAKKHGPTGTTELIQIPHKSLAQKNMVGKMQSSQQNWRESSDPRGQIDKVSPYNNNAKKNSLVVKQAEHKRIPSNYKMSQGEGSQGRFKNNVGGRDSNAGSAYGDQFDHRPGIAAAQNMHRSSQSKPETPRKKVLERTGDDMVVCQSRPSDLRADPNSRKLQNSEKVIKKGLETSRDEDKEDRGKMKIIDDPNLTPKEQILASIVARIKEGEFDTKTEYYKIGKVIGKGAFGKVNLAIHRLTEKFVALKSISKQMMKDSQSLKKVRQEYNILKRARHQNIVRLYESFDTDLHIVYVMEVCGGGDLLTYVRRRRKLKEDYAKFLFKQIIMGLQYVHSKGVLHRDIKLDNILLTSEGEVKICDFGVSKLVANKNALQTEQCGTPAYIAPEVFKGKGYRGFQSDIWSAGVVLYAMLFGTVPFKATNMVELQQQIIKVQCNWGQPGDITPAALQMLKAVLEPDPTKRLTPAQIIADPWMQMTEAQIDGVQVFTEYERQKIEAEFEYYNQKKEGDVGEDPFLEQVLQTTQNSLFKNNSTKSVILAPFNSTKSHISEDFHLQDSVQEILLPKDVLVFSDKCREVNRQYMLNNNAELDNGVYNENEQEKKEEEKQEDGLVGLNQQIEAAPPMSKPISEENPGSNPESYPASKVQSNIQSLNNSQVVVDEEKVEAMAKFGYSAAYVIEEVSNDELNHATATYYLIDQSKEF